jgi:hypothetical protein
MMIHSLFLVVHDGGCSWHSEPRGMYLSSEDAREAARWLADDMLGLGLWQGFQRPREYVIHGTATDPQYMIRVMSEFVTDEAEHASMRHQRQGMELIDELFYDQYAAGNGHPLNPNH